MEVFDTALKLFHKRPRIKEKGSGTLVILQTLCSILNFVCMLNLLVTEEIWFEYTPPDGGPTISPVKEDFPQLKSLIIAAVVMSTLSLILIVLPTKNTKESWIVTKAVSLLSLSSFACLMAAVVELFHHSNANLLGNMVFHLPLTYLLASVSLNLAGVLLFLVLIIFGVDPKFAPNFRNLVIALITIVFYLFFGGLIFWKLEGWVYEDSIMFCLVTLTSIGYGNIAPTTLTTRLIVIFYGMSGLGFVAFAIEQFRQLLVEDIAKKFAKQVTKLSKKVTQSGDDLPVDEENEKKNEKRQLWQKRLGVVLGLLTWWVCGAAIFMAMEEWEFFESFYFSFVTLSTIGYGDYYPKSSAGKTFLVFFSLVGLGLFAFGLSTLSDTTTDELSGQLDGLKGMFTKSADGLGKFGKEGIDKFGGKFGEFGDKFGEFGGKVIPFRRTQKNVLETEEGKVSIEVVVQGDLESPSTPNLDSGILNESKDLEKEKEKEKEIPKDTFEILNQEDLVKLGIKLSKSLKKLTEAQSQEATDAWIAQYLKLKEKFEATFTQKQLEIPEASAESELKQDNSSQPIIEHDKENNRSSTKKSKRDSSRRKSRTHSVDAIQLS